jgi:uncharacterized metal-binding protein
MLRNRLTAIATSVIFAVPLLGCSSVGGLMQSVGGGLTDYSKKEDGFLNKAAGVAGGVYNSVGGAIKGDSGSEQQKAPPSGAAASSPSTEKK